MQKLLRRAEAAQYLQGRGLRCAPSTLAKLAVGGGGPAYVRIGVYPFYSTADLDDWIRAKTSRPITQAAEIPVKGQGWGPQTKPTTTPTTQADRPDSKPEDNESDLLSDSRVA